jgi:cell division protein FtsQ
MTDASAESQVNQILDRRRQLKLQRRIRFWQGVWRTSVTLGLAVGVGWALCRPEWEIRQASQVKIVTADGVAPRSQEILEQFLAFSYPFSLMALYPQDIVRRLETHAHVSQATVTRQLFPPHVIISVQEHPPVAVTKCDRCVLTANPTDPQSIQLGPAKIWLLDHRGVALPMSSYPDLKPDQLPSLTVGNFLQTLPNSKASALTSSTDTGPATPVKIDPRKQRQWQQLFPILHKSPVEIDAIGWQNGEELTLTTQLGQVRLGPYGPQFAQQLQALDQMRSLPKSVDPGQIVYIDLEQPERPVLELRNPPKPKPVSLP